MSSAVKCKMFGTDIKVQDVLKRLRDLDPSKSMGVDSIHLHVLKACEIAFAYPVTLVFAQSMETGVTLKRSNVTPLFKKGCKEG